MNFTFRYWNRRRGTASVKKEFNDLESFKEFALQQPRGHYKLVVDDEHITTTISTTDTMATGEELFSTAEKLVAARIRVWEEK